MIHKQLKTRVKGLNSIK